MTYSVLILGASYGSLFGTKLLMAGHDATLVCTPPTAELINRDGTIVRFPVRGRDELVEVRSPELPGTLRASAPEHADPAGYDLVVLGMQEAQYGASGVSDLIERVARSRVPCLAIMNMPPLPYLRRIPGLETGKIERCYTDPGVWKSFDRELVTLASPDPQAFRPPDEPKNVLQVGLPTNFKAARFEKDEPTAILDELAKGIEEARYDPGDGPIEIPVKLRVHDSLFVPLAKWPMLIAGNYRCIRADAAVAIRDAVHGDVDASRGVYEWVRELCTGLGASDDDLVPFEKYARAAKGLEKPSSAARALFSGARNIERVDCLVREIAAQRNLRLEALDEVVGLVDAQLQKNRSG